MVNSDEWKASDTKLFATVVVDPNHKEQLKKMLDSYLQHHITGVVVGGVHMGESAAFRRTLIQSIREIIGEDMLMMTHAANTLEDMVDDLSHGIDIVHSTYCTTLTNSGSALLYNQTLKQTHSNVVVLESKKKRTRDASSSSAGEDHAADSHSSSKRMRTEEGVSDVSTILSSLHAGGGGEDEDGEGLKIEVSTVPIDKFSINLWDPVYRRDTRPLVSQLLCSFKYL